MAFEITYSNARVENGCELESSCVVMDGAVEVCRFSVLGYKDEAGRTEMAKARLAEYIARAGYEKGKPAPVHPAMKASDTVDAAALEPKAVEPK